MDKLTFSPENGFMDSGSYPDPATETDVRTQLFSLHQQTRDYINDKLLPQIDNLAAASGDPATVESMTAKIDAATKAANDAKAATEKAAVVTKQITLTSEGWVDRVYTIEDELITATSDQDIDIPVSDTDVQAKVLQKANIRRAGQEAGKMKIRAMGTVPTVDIPVEVTFRG